MKVPVMKVYEQVTLQWLGMFFTADQIGRFSYDNCII